VFDRNLNACLLKFLEAIVVVYFHTCFKSVEKLNAKWNYLTLSRKRSVNYLQIIQILKNQSVIFAI